MDLVRKLISDKLLDLELSRKEVSLLMGRNETYLQQFLTKGSPRELPERERIKLAEILKVSEDELRGPSSPVPKRSYVKHSATTRESFIDSTSRSPHSDERASPKIISGAELFAGLDLPVFGTAQGGGGALIITERAVDWVARPSVLLRVQDGYGMIVTGDSMDPAIKSGATALINPHLPPRVGDLCLFRNHADDGAVHAVIKEFRGETEAAWKVRQYTPAKDFTLKKSDWQVVHRIVGSYFA
jgi:phage repressor protein C with HTH and peptisase S24 domain